MSAEHTGLPPGWTWATLGDLGEWVGGGTPSKSKEAYWTGGTIPWVSPKDMKCPVIDDAEDYITEAAVAESSTQLVPAESVLVVTRSGILQHTVPVALAARPVAVNQDLKALVTRPGIVPSFVARFIQASQRVILDRCSKAGTTVASIGLDSLKAFPIPLPPTAEQRCIVAKLDELLGSRRAVRAAVDAVPAMLEQYRQAVLAAACDGALTGGWIPCPGQARARQIVSLGDLTELVTSGSRGWAEFYASEGSIFIRSQDINEDRLSLDNVAHVSLPDRAEGRRTQVKRNDLLIIITGANVGRVARVDIDLADAYVSQHVALVRLADPSQAAFLHLWLTSERHGRGQLLRSAYGGGKPGLNLGNLRALEVQLPTHSEQAAIVERVAEQLAGARQQQARVNALRASLSLLESAVLAAAFRGELAPQDPAYEPASVLLERFRSERVERPVRPSRHHPAHT